MGRGCLRVFPLDLQLGESASIFYMAWIKISDVLPTLARSAVSKLSAISYPQLPLLALFLLDLLCLLEGLTWDGLGHVNSFALQQIFNRRNLDARIIFSLEHI
jgi:hypothetical protein